MTCHSGGTVQKECTGSRNLQQSHWRVAQKHCQRFNHIDLVQNGGSIQKKIDLAIRFCRDWLF